ncbi:uncharacterized protein LOC141907017 [Tubulanus polymorphus]|uniref:uncharacterized protein LOC141907017 n=1 Tax=Tubulanus polymorphus TaxID=672921 RepID=UPI003DA55A59
MYLAATGVYIFVLTLAMFVSSLARRSDYKKSADVPHIVNSTAEEMATLMSRYRNPRPESQQWGCRELRSRRVFSDGFCTSIKPITEVVCTGHCLPTDLPWYAEYLKVWSARKMVEYRCHDDVVKKKRIRLLCKNGELRTYRVKVVRSCKCKRYLREQNKTKIPEVQDKKDAKDKVDKRTEKRQRRRKHRNRGRGRGRGRHRGHKRRKHGKIKQEKVDGSDVTQVGKSETETATKIHPIATVTNDRDATT